MFDSSKNAANRRRKQNGGRAGSPLHAVNESNTARTESRALPGLSPFLAAETLDAIFQLRCAGRACAVDTTEDLSIRFNAVADDTAITVRANRRQRVDCALEAIEDVVLSAHDDFKRLVIFVLANFACGHIQFVRARGGCWRCLFRVAHKILSRPASSMPASCAPKFFWS